VLIAEAATLIVVLVITRRSVLWQLLPLLALGAGALTLLQARSVGTAYAMVAANDYGDGKLFCFYVQELSSNSVLALGCDAVVLVLILFALFRAVRRVRTGGTVGAVPAPKV
jgi:hypothetical protein